MTTIKYSLVTFKNVYELFGDSPEGKEMPDHLAGTTRYGCVVTTEISKPFKEVKAVLWNLRSCPDWHPFVEYTEFKGNPKPDPTGAGAVRKCGFYKGANGIDYVWEEFLDMSDDKIITFIQEENRPSILKYVGKVFKIEPKDENTTILHVNHTYLPNYMPLSLPLAKFMMPSKMAHETYALGWCIKYNCETGKVAKFDMVPHVTFKRV